MTPAPELWPRGASTGIGSHPGTDIDEALSVVFGELPLPYLPELPARGPGADILGRGAGLLVDMPVELYAANWRMTSRPGVDARRTRDMWERDLDSLTEVAAGYSGPLKVQSAGPWTLAAGIQLPVGGASLRDAGAVRDLTDSLTEGLRRHIAEVKARVPGASVILQLDEPSLPAALAGRIPTESGLGTLRAVRPQGVREALAGMVKEVGAPVVVHCCAPDVPVDLLRSAGVAGVALDLTLLVDLDPLGAAIDAGLGLFAGVSETGLNAVGGAGTAAKKVAEQVTRLWRTLGFSPDELPYRVVVAPACGLAGATPAGARAALVACRDAARYLAEGD